MLELTGFMPGIRASGGRPPNRHRPSAGAPHLAETQAGPVPGAYSAALVSTISVTGPSLTSSTCIIAPNRPV